MSDRTFQLLSIDDDPIFLLGLRTALQPFSDLQVIAEAQGGADALQMLAEATAVDLVVVEPSLNRSYPRTLTGLQLCQQLKAQYPNLPILLLGSSIAPSDLAAAKAIGVEGYCRKGTDIAVIVAAIRQLISGGTYWIDRDEGKPLLASGKQEAGSRGDADLFVAPPSGENGVNPTLQNWRYRLRRHGLQQIDRSLVEVTSLLQNPGLSNLDWLVWSGRRRELRAARWLVNQLLPQEIVVTPQMPGNAPLAIADLRVETSRSRLSIAPQQLNIFDATRAKLQMGITNLTSSPLEIDLLRDDKKRELLDIILGELETVLEQLRSSQIQPAQLPQKLPSVMRDLWQVSLTNFFGKYYTLTIGDRDYEVVNILIQDTEVVRKYFLNKIPLLVELFLHLLFEAPLIIDNISYPAETAEAKARGEIILQNLIIQTANGVMQPLLNRLPDVEVIKQRFYNKRLISNRGITELRNSLSWKYRLEQYIDEPKAIFESRYNLLVFNGAGIRKISIYAPRREELEQLTGIQLAVTLILELRDAIAPRLRSAISFIGTGVIYVLTQVIGRGIGLIGRGIIQGIGSSVQETRFGKNGDRQN